MVQQQEITFRLTLYRALCVVCAQQCTLLCICLLCAPLASMGLLCNFCPTQPRRSSSSNCTNATTECGPQSRCYTGTVFFGKVPFLYKQGCASRELCGTVQLVIFNYASYPMNYTCCCGDRCNLRPKQSSALHGIIPDSHGGITTNGTAEDCPEDNHLPEQSNPEVGPGVKVPSYFNRPMLTKILTKF